MLGLRRLEAFLLAFAVGVSMSFSIFILPAYASSDDYPSKWKNAAKDSLFDDWGYYNRECVSFVAWRLSSQNGMDSSAIKGLGNASTWKSRAISRGYEVNNIPAVGSVAWFSYGHVAWVESINGDGTVHIEEYNYDYAGHYNERDVAASKVGAFIHFADINTSAAPVIPAQTSGRMLFVRGDDMLFASDEIGGSWSNLTGSGWVGSESVISVGGTDGKTQIWINSCGAVYAKSSLGQDGWTEEGGCGTAQAAAISNTGLQMLLTPCGAVFAKYGVGVGGWIFQQDCGSFTAIATGGNTQMLLSSCGAVYAKDNNLGYGGWTEEAACGTASQISVSSTGLQMITTPCGAIFSKNGVSVGGWWAEGDCGWATKVIAGGNVHMFLSSCSAVYAKTSMGYGNWVEESPCGTANDIAIGSNGRQLLISADSAVFVRDGIGIGGWSMQVGPGNAKAIAVS